MKPLQLLPLLALIGAPCCAQTPMASTSQPVAPLRDLFSDTWVATDALGRALPLGGEVRPPQKDKFVGIFYFVWQGHHGTPGPHNITKLIAANPRNPQWAAKDVFHWWGEPEVGYYRATDPWVARRNLSMLAVAGVDCLFVDVTNAFTYPAEMKVLFETARQMRAQGNPTPQIAFVLNAHTVPTLNRLWNEWYKPRLYEELWFRWEGKPLILADIEAKTEKGEPISDEAKAFFTWRKSWFETDPRGWFGDGRGKWPWRDKTPQKPGLSPAGEVEQVAVGVASHPVFHNIGRSYANDTPVKLDELDMTATYDQGIQFEEQWKRALEIDPPLVFVTGWNEWVAQRQIGGAGDLGDLNLVGRPIREGDTFFVDVYNAEFSRDADPMKGGYTDNYYLQLVANIRKYKGARPVPVAGKAQSIDISGDFSQWNGVTPEFRDTVGDTLHRDHAGWGDLHYKNTSGRNDIVSCKVARDARNVYFYARTAQPLSPSTDARWVMLFLNSDQNSATGWNGYDFLVSGTVLNGREITISRWENGGWQRNARGSFRARGNELQIAVPRSSIGQSTGQVGFDFKWVDNADPNDLSSWFTNGDCAPPRRFNYRYATE
ncbi:MAG: hypothetical protein KY445_02980 [Armatimonadetes bacterium]|nr:hypothetical protein [Armatimonadota bacterium]